VANVVNDEFLAVGITRRVRTVMENLEKSWNFKTVLKSPKLCYINMFIQTVYILYALEFSLLV